MLAVSMSLVSPICFDELESEESYSSIRFTLPKGFLHFLDKDWRFIETVKLVDVHNMIPLAAKERSDCEKSVTAISILCALG